MQRRSTGVINTQVGILLSRNEHNPITIESHTVSVPCSESQAKVVSYIEQGISKSKCQSLCVNIGKVVPQCHGG